MQQQTIRITTFCLLLGSFFLLFFFQFVHADPSGSTIVSGVTQTGPNITPGNRNDSRGTITTLILSSLQQDQHWKAYVGNISGSLTLDNPNNFTIYSWDLTTISGQVYASRFGNLSWTSVSCADPSLINNESTFHNMTVSNQDRINATFNWTIHKQFNVGSNTITQNTCNSTVTYANDTRQTPTIASPFQEVLIKDSNSYLVYMTDISDNVQGYDNTTYDFQMIVAESDIKPLLTSYYFYVELR